MLFGELAADLDLLVDDLGAGVRLQELLGRASLAMTMRYRTAQ